MQNCWLGLVMLCQLFKITVITVKKKRKVKQKTLVASSQKENIPLKIFLSKLLVF